MNKKFSKAQATASRAGSGRVSSPVSLSFHKNDYFSSKLQKKGGKEKQWEQRN